MSALSLFWEIMTPGINMSAFSYPKDIVDDILQSCRDILFYQWESLRAHPLR